MSDYEVVNDRIVDEILGELTEEEIRNAGKVMSALLRGVQEDRIKPRPELLHSILVCSLLLNRHSCRRLLKSLPAR